MAATAAVPGGDPPASSETTAAALPAASLMLSAPSGAATGAADAAATAAATTAATATNTNAAAATATNTNSTTTAFSAPPVPTTTFATLAHGRLPRSLDDILQPSTLLPAVLQYIDVPTLAALRSLPLFRDRIAELVRAQTASGGGTIADIGIPSNIVDHLILASASETDFVLQNSLTDTYLIHASENNNFEAGQDDDQSVGQVVKVLALNKLGLMALASSPIASEVSLRNLILQEVPGIDDWTMGMVYERISKNEAASAATLLLLIDKVKHLMSTGFVPSPSVCETYPVPFYYPPPREEDPSVCNRVINNISMSRNASPTVLAKVLAATSDKRSLECVASNPNASQDILSSIVASYYSNPREYLLALLAALAHPNISLSHLESFAVDEKYEIRGAVASNTAAPPYLLSRLSKNKKTGAWMKIASNTSTPKEDLLRLAKDAWIYRLYVGRNPRIDVDEVFNLDDGRNHDDGKNNEIIAELSRDARKLNLIYTCDSDDEDVCAALAINPYTPIEILEKLAASDDLFVRGAVARNKSAPPVILNKLVSIEQAEEAEDVVHYAIENPATDPEAIASYLRSLKHDTDSIPTDPIQYHDDAEFERIPYSIQPVLSDDFLWSLDSLSHRNDVPASALALMSKSRYFLSRAVIARNRSLPSSDLSRLSKESKEPFHAIVQSIADNPKAQGAAVALSGCLSLSGFSKPGNE